MALVVVTGGARSGKSAAAQRLVERRMQAGHAPDGVVVAVFGSAEDDPEMAARIERHRAERPEGFETLEATDPVEWMADVPDGALLLLDCIATLVGLAMTRHAFDAPHEVTDVLDETLASVTGWLAERGGDTVVVTNEVGCGVVPAYASGRVFRDVLGRANATLVSGADAAYLALGGRLLDLHTLPRDIEWPR